MMMLRKNMAMYSQGLLGFISGFHGANFICFFLFAADTAAEASDVAGEASVCAWQRVEVLTFRENESGTGDVETAIEREEGKSEEEEANNTRRTPKKEEGKG